MGDLEVVRCLSACCPVLRGGTNRGLGDVAGESVRACCELEGMSLEGKDRNLRGLFFPLTGWYVHGTSF